MFMSMKDATTRLAAFLAALLSAVVFFLAAAAVFVFSVSFLCALIGGCGPEQGAFEGGEETGESGDLGRTWGPCDLDAPEGEECEPDTRCVKPVPESDASFCAMEAPCDGVDWPGFGTEVREHAGICVASCETDDDCAEGQICAPAPRSMCAWIP